MSSKPSGPFKTHTVCRQKGKCDFRTIQQAVDKARAGDTIRVRNGTYREAVRISGGTEPHTVSVTENPPRQRSYACDCADFAKGHALCKHVLRAKMAMHDDVDLRPLVAAFKRPHDNVALRYALGDLWMKAGKIYDTYFARRTEAATSKRPR